MTKNIITTLFLDIGGVLLSNGWGHEFRQVAVEKFHLNKEEIEARHKMMFGTFEEGKISLDDYLDQVVFYEPRNFSRQEFREFMFSLSTEHADVMDYFKKLKAQYGLKIVAVSNEGRELNAYRIKTFELGTLIDFFISSCYVHLRKPDVNIYKLALDTAQVLPEEVVCIDDRQTFVDIATGLGIKGIRHIDCATTSKALASMGLPLMDKNKSNA